MFYHVSRNVRDFRECIDDCELLDVPPMVPFFTWFNGRAGGARVDRALVSSDFPSGCWIFYCCVLARHYSDHNPILFGMQFEQRHISRFRFQAMWISHGCLRNVISDHWNLPPPSLLPIQQLCHKLKTLCQILRRWNREVFGNFDHNIQNSQQHLEMIQNEISREGIPDHLIQEEMEAHAQLDLHLAQKETYLKEKCGINWLKEGDRNSAFFHCMANQKKTTGGISSLFINDSLTTNPDVISGHIISFCKTLFSKDDLVQVDVGLVESVIPAVVSTKENNALIFRPSTEEIKDTVLCMNGSSAPGPDGVTGVFFHNFSDIVGHDICREVHQFFDTG